MRLSYHIKSRSLRIILHLIFCSSALRYLCVRIPSDLTHLYLKNYHFLMQRTLQDLKKYVCDLYLWFGKINVLKWSQYLVFFFSFKLYLLWFPTHFLSFYNLPLQGLFGDVIDLDYIKQLHLFLKQKEVQVHPTFYHYHVAAVLTRFHHYYSKQWVSSIASLDRLIFPLSTLLFTFPYISFIAYLG